MPSLDDIPTLPPCTPTGDDLIAVIDGSDRRSPKRCSLNQLASIPSETWVIEGDSWSAGTAQGNDRQTWPFYLASISPAGVEIVNLAVAGTTAQTMVSTFAATATPNLTAKPSTCFIFGGINDAATRTTTQLRDDLRSLWTSARAAGARVVAFTLPHRTAGGGWSQANWKIINDQIIADSSYYDALVRTDIFASNSLSVEYTDLLHITTAAHKKLATEVLRSLRGEVTNPSLPSDFVAGTAGNVTFAANTRRNLPFLETIDANSDGTTTTVGGDVSTSIFTAPVDGTYEIYGNISVHNLTAGDLSEFTAWVTPIATGVESDHRLDHKSAGGTHATLSGKKRRRLLRGDTVRLSATTTRANATIPQNANNAEFSVSLVSIP